MLKDKVKLQVFLGMVGTGIVFLLWKIIGLTYGSCFSPAMKSALNIIATLFLPLPSLLAAKLTKDKLSNYGFSRHGLLRQILLGIGIGLGMAAVLTLLPILVFGKETVYIGTGYHTAAEAIGGLVYFVFAVGLSEEFIFRGFLYTKLDSFCVTDGMPIFLSSALFGLFHLSGFNLTQVLFSGLIGAFFCICKKELPGCTIFSLAIAHGIHDWMIRLLPSLL